MSVLRALNIRRHTHTHLERDTQGAHGESSDKVLKDPVCNHRILVQQSSEEIELRIWELVTGDANYPRHLWNQPFLCQDEVFLRDPFRMVLNKILPIVRLLVNEQRINS